MERTAGGPDTEGRPVPRPGRVGTRAARPASGRDGRDREADLHRRTQRRQPPRHAGRGAHGDARWRDLVHRRAWFSPRDRPGHGAVIKREELEGSWSRSRKPPSEGQGEDGAVSRLRSPRRSRTGCGSRSLGKHDLWFRPGFSYWVIGQTRRGMTFGADPIRDVRTRLRQQVRLTALFGWGPFPPWSRCKTPGRGLENSTSSNEGNVDLHQGWVRGGRERGPRSLGASHRRASTDLGGDATSVRGAAWNTVGQSFNAIGARRLEEPARGRVGRDARAADL